MYTYRNRHTGQVVRRDQRWPRLDNLPDRWVLDEPPERARHAKPDPPARSDAKSAWVDYAVAHGARVGDAEAATKAELIDQYSN